MFNERSQYHYYTLLFDNHRSYLISFLGIYFLLHIQVYTVQETIH